MSARPPVPLRARPAWGLAAGACVILLALAKPATADEPIRVVEDTLFSVNGSAGSNPWASFYHLGSNGVAREIYTEHRPSGGTGYVYVYGPSRELRYVYTPPSPQSPLNATLTFIQKEEDVAAWYALEFRAGSATTGEEVSGRGFSHTGSFLFAPRVPLTGALNASNRVWIHPGESNTTGFVIDPGESNNTGFGIEGGRSVLIRGVGPSLAKFDVSTPLSDPLIELFDAKGVCLAKNDRWGADTIGAPSIDAQGLGWIFELVGAFPLEAGSADAALLYRTGDGGAFTVRASAAGAAEKGEALIEVYVLPFGLTYNHH